MQISGNNRLAVVKNMNAMDTTQLLSVYRVELMAVAMIWIMFFHSGIIIPDAILPVRYIKSIGYAGADIFFLLSGLGLTHGMSKTKEVSTFFKRRFDRIIPTFWLIVVLAQFKDVIIGEFNINKLLLSLSGFDFIIHGSYHRWFIPAILICYLIFPIYYNLSNKYGIFRILIIFSLGAFLISFLISGTSLQYLLIFSIRLPIFFAGVCIGQLLIYNRQIPFLNNKWILLLVLLISVTIVIVNTYSTSGEQIWYNRLYWYPTIMMAYPLCALLGLTLRRIDYMAPKLLPMIRPFGVYSLELYLFHTIIFAAADKFPLNKISFNFFRVPEYMIYIIVSLAFAVATNKIILRLRLSISS